MLFSVILDGSSSLPNRTHMGCFNINSRFQCCQRSKGWSCVGSSAYGLWCLYLTLIVERKSQHSMSAGLWLFEIRILSECPRDTSSYPIHQTSHSYWDSPCVWGSRMSMVLVGLNNPRLILLNVKVIRSMVHQIRVWRCGGQGSEESLRELLDSLLCWI